MSNRKKKLMAYSFVTLIVGCSLTGTERFSCEFSDKSQTIFSFSEIEDSITLGGISFNGRESWTRDILITDEVVSLQYVQGLATRTDDGEHVGFKDLYHYQFDRLEESLSIETKLDSIQTGPADWIHPAYAESGQCKPMSSMTYWKIFFTALLRE